MVYIKIRNGRSQRGLRHLCIATANLEPHTAHQWRQIIAEHHRKMSMGIVPWVNEGRALIVWVATPLLFLETVQFRDKSLFAHDFGRRIISSNFFPLMARRTLVFCWRYDGLFDWKRLVVRFWERRHSEGKGMEKAF